MDTLTVLASSYYGDDGQEECVVRPLVSAERLRDSRIEANFAFGDFQLVPRSRLLLRNGCSVDLGSRAFDLLHALLKSAGELVSKEALVREVWPNTFVDESNLRFQMTCLRKALGEERHYITTVPGRGYIFTGDCHRRHSFSDRPEAANADTLGGQGQTAGPAQLLSFPIRLTEEGDDERAPSSPHGSWYLASVSIMCSSNEPSAALAPASVTQDFDGAQQPPVELLLPLLVMSGHSDTNCSYEQSPGAATIDLASLMDLLRGALAFATAR
jgi:DNA-binding winged helix-turn-helix (wHTH) protein